MLDSLRVAAVAVVAVVPSIARMDASCAAKADLVLTVEPWLAWIRKDFTPPGDGARGASTPSDTASTGVQGDLRLCSWIA